MHTSCLGFTSKLLAQSLMDTTGTPSSGWPIARFPRLLALLKRDAIGGVCGGGGRPGMIEALA